MKDPSNEESGDEGDSSTDPNNKDVGGRPDPKKDGRWTDEEHAKFIEGLYMYGKNWNKVHKHVITRSSAQTRSHAQKYFNKLIKSGTKEAQE